MPAAGMSLIWGALEGDNEVNVWMLSKSMGMKPLPFVIAAFIFTTLGTLFYGTIFCLVIGFYIVSKSSFSLLVVTVLAFIYANFF